MAHNRFTTRLRDRGRLVLPADVRRRLDLDTGDVLVIVVDDEDRLVVRKATDVAHGLRGYARHVAAERDLAAELLAERRAEVEHEAGEAADRARR